MATCLTVITGRATHGFLRSSNTEAATRNSKPRRSQALPAVTLSVVPTSCCITWGHRYSCKVLWGRLFRGSLSSLSCLTTYTRRVYSFGRGTRRS